MSDSRWLVLMDTDRIKDYLFATNRLKEIRGASLLLEKLNQQICRKLLKKGEEIFIGGGGVLATFTKETHAQDYISAVQAEYRKETHIATISGVAVPIIDENEQEALKQARLQLRLAKQNPTRAAGTHALLASPYFHLCQSCSSYPAVEKRDGDTICVACAAKRDEANVKFPNYSGYVRFAARIAEGNGRRLDRRWLDLTRLPDKLDQLEGLDTGHIGFIHADVNGLGSFLEQQGSLAAIKKIGKEVEDALESALVAAVETVQLEPREANQWSFLIIVLGGDDVTLIVPAKKAVPLANALCQAFAQQIRETTGNLALSAGVVISKPKHPAHALAALAEDLTRNAKRLSYELEIQEEQGPVPTLDFQVVHTPTANPIHEVREEEYYEKRDGQEYKYTSRPLPCGPFGASPGISTLLDTVINLRRSGFPRNKLAEWADLIYTSEIEQILAWQTLQTRVSGEAYQALLAAIRDFGLTRERVFAQPGGVGQPYLTPLLDLVELYDFVTLPEQRHD
jgi:hypothetical protein